MKILYSLPTLYIGLLSVLAVNAQTPQSSLYETSTRWQEERDSTGLPGDHFSLQGALALFKKASSPEEFERLLNTQENNVNNLDLNTDGNIDYIRVINKKQQQVQLFILQALVSNQESQDVAVIELEKTGEGTAIIQIVGDEDIYGESTIAEPAEEQTITTPTNNNYNNYNNNYNNSNYNNSNYNNYNNYNNNYYNSNNYNNDYDYNRPHGPSAETPETYSTPAATATTKTLHNALIRPAGIAINVWFWPCVRRVYAPAYIIWTSPWTWVNPPGWWRPWRPLPWHSYRPACYRYRHGYMYAYTRRIAPAPVMYRPIRRSSVIVMNRNRMVITNYRGSRVDRGGNYPPNRFNNGYYSGGRNGGYNGIYSPGRNSYNGYNNNGYNRNSYNRNDYNYNRNDYNRNDYNRNSYNRDSYNRNGSTGNNGNRNGVNSNRDNSNRDNSNRDNYNRDNYNRNGSNREGSNGNGSNSDRNGTGSRYNDSNSRPAPTRENSNQPSNGRTRTNTSRGIRVSRGS